MNAGTHLAEARGVQNGRASVKEEVSVARIPVMRSGLLIAAMLGAVLAVGLLSGWDAARESQAGLDNFALDQRTFAATVAGGLLARSETLPPPREIDLLSVASRFSVPNELVVLLQPPDSQALLEPHGHPISSPLIAQAVSEQRETSWLDRPSAAALGLPARRAAVGLAHADLPSGRWQVMVVATAERLRDRDQRGVRRLWLGTAVAALLVLGFGGLALREQRREIRLEADLRIAAISRERDEQLRRIGHSASLVALSSGVAHEVSTPLGVIIGRAEQLLERTAGDDRSQRAARGILEQANRINEVVRGFLHLARGGPPALRTVAAEEVVSGAVELVEHKFAEASVALNVELPKTLPELRCDLWLLQHALVNLLLNACDASPKGAAVEISASLSEVAITFAVTDHGAGIAPGDAARALAPFFTTKAEGKGTGMGLAIANEIAQSHRGTISLTPGFNGGTRALLQIPLAIDATSELGATNGQAQHP
jgi:two-component system NtrC family sensor kinase